VLQSPEIVGTFYLTTTVLLSREGWETPRSPG